MFSGLREKSILYVFDKSGKTPRLMVGEVVERVTPENQFQNGMFQFPIGMQPQSIVVKVRINGNVLTIGDLPRDATISIDNKSNCVVTDNERDMLQEVSKFRAQHQAIIDNYDLAQEVVAACDEMLPMLDHNIAKQKDAEKRMSEVREQVGVLEQRIGGIEGTLGNIEGFLKQLTAGGQSSKSK